VNDFYERVLRDPQLAPYFEGVDLARLKRHRGAVDIAGIRRPGKLRRTPA
jgi:hemoglobin